MSETKIDYSKVEAGQQTDALVHRAVFGNDQYPHDFIDNGYGDCRRCDCFHDQGAYRGGGRFCSVPPPYSSDITMAWMIVDHFAGPLRNHRCVVVSITEPNEWWCEIGHQDDDPIDDEFRGNAQSASLAICRAALMATASRPDRRQRRR